MARCSINFTNAQENELKKEAKKQNISLTKLVQNLLFYNQNNNHFGDFMTEQQQLNEQIVEALKGIDNRLAFNNSASALVLRSIPGGIEHFNKLHAHYFPTKEV